MSLAIVPELCGPPPHYGATAHGHVWMDLSNGPWDGLSACSRCGGFEGSLATDCPGWDDPLVQQLIYCEGWDFKSGNWVRSPVFLGNGSGPQYWKPYLVKEDDMPTSKHKDLLNDLDAMQKSPAYAVRKAVLSKAEDVIFSQEQYINELEQKLGINQKPSTGDIGG